ncbi:hypothetical protein CVIRNUC_000622 [Coccomyxa viridis]|uniref:protein-tyrosine-phosphatase n=1 Tax=Coccomyxa viridis TaxID=1274662 RepID=A0AAV1HU96_9CHLO|nr:hypothetical protein CVIRNUC_000622 [Coccomyxa viridis]
MMVPQRSMFAGCGQAVDIVAGRLTFVAVTDRDAFASVIASQHMIEYNVDRELVYWPFFKDFGPLNLGLAYRFCRKTAQMLQEAETQGRHLVYHTGPGDKYKANAAVLVGMFQVLLLQRAPERAYKLLQPLEPFLPFRDPSMGTSLFDLTVYHCLCGVGKARDVGFLDWHLPSSDFNLAEYEHYEQVENGDLNWIVPGKFLAFSGPAAQPFQMGTYVTHTPEDYHRYFHLKGVKAVVRLNNQTYDGQRFVSGGFAMHELFFPDGSCPSDSILQRFLKIAESTEGSLAVHCKAGLGRTGVLICAYLIKHHGFTAEEAIGYIRICRPGSVIGPQQKYLISKAKQLAAEGREFREALQAKSGPTSKPEDRTKRISRASFSINASSLRRAPVAPSAPVSAMEPDSAPAVAGLYRTSSNGTAKTMSVDGGKDPDHVSDPATASTADSNRFTRFMRRHTTVRITAAKLGSQSTVRTRSQSVQALSKPGSQAAAASRGRSQESQPKQAAQMGVARMLAPNGQPRKMPAALLQSGDSEALQHFESLEEATPEELKHGWTIGAASQKLLSTQRTSLRS